MAQADIYELQWDGKTAILKDFSARPTLVRRWWSRPILARELRVLMMLQGMPGVPEIYATAGPDAFIMERLNAAPMPGRKMPPPPDHFWASARAVLAELHSRGISHGDIRRKNLMIDHNGQACLIDFATAIIQNNSRLSRFLCKRCQRIDHITYARIKASYNLDNLDEEEQRWLDEEPWYLRLARGFKKRFFPLRRASFWRKKIHKTRRAVKKIKM